MDFFDRFIAQVTQNYPETARDFDFREHLSPLLFCPEIVRLPVSLRRQAEEIVKSFFALRNIESRRSELAARSPSVPDPGHTSVLMSYDFHVDDAGNLRLIEINTNASMSLMVDVLHSVQALANPFSTGFRREIIDCFFSDYELAKIGRPLRRVAIVDENPPAQRLYAEFRCYAELFCREGLDVTIHDPRQLTFHSDRGLCRPDGEAIDLVYNRGTDFYFEAPESRPLREAMLARAACLTPHPHEYRLLADKERLVELGRPGALEAVPLSTEQRDVVTRTLIRSAAVADFADAATVWAERKKLFFKPMRSFGGKAAYRGGSLSRRVFEEILRGDYLAQDFVPAAHIKLATAQDGDFKYDLRFFVYNDRIQEACARVYQGQMTNSQTSGGGVAVIDWI